MDKHINANSVQVVGECPGRFGIKNNMVQFTCPLGHKYNKEMYLPPDYDTPYFDINQMRITTKIEQSLDTETCEECGVVYMPSYKLDTEKVLQHLLDCYISEDLNA